MKVALLAGGLGTRLAEETDSKPKPMVEVGGHPIIWHIMNIYASFGFKDFIVALGYKGELIKEYFLNFHPHNSDLTVNLATGRLDFHKNKAPDWNVTLVDTGQKTETGGRVKRLEPWLGKKTFMLTYGDGVCNVNLTELLAFHRDHGKLATVTAVHPPARFGALSFKGEQVLKFAEKPQTGEGWINGGFFVLEPDVLDYIDSDETIFEREPLERLARAKQLVAYRHSDFWQCMDTLRDLRLLESLWERGQAPWKVWDSRLGGDVRREVR